MLLKHGFQISECQLGFAILKKAAIFLPLAPHLFLLIGELSFIVCHRL